MAEKRYLPQLTYVEGGKKFTFILKRKPMKNEKAWVILENLFGEKSKTKKDLILGVRRAKV